MKTCYIVGAGEFYGSFSPKADDLVIAADGGYNSLCERGIRCDLLIGDMDSIAKIPSEVETIRHKVQKDETDMHLAYLEGARRGCSDFAIYGGVGGRPDHTFANYCLLSYIREHGERAKLYDKTSVVYAIRNEKVKLCASEGKTVSVFAFGNKAHGVSVRGLYYTLEGGTLTPDFSLGVSNHTVGTEAEIEVTDGTLLIFEEI